MYVCMYSVRMCMKYTSTRTTTRVVRVSSVHSPDCTCIHIYMQLHHQHWSCCSRKLLYACILQQESIDEVHTCISFSHMRVRERAQTQCVTPLSTQIESERDAAVGKRKEGGMSVPYNERRLESYLDKLSICVCELEFCLI